MTTIVKSHKRTTRKAKATREDQYGNLPIHKEVIPLPEEDKYCPYCNSKMEYVTEMFVREELRITPAKVEEPSEIYDLLGRRQTSKQVSGIYIKNGKKVIVK